MKQVKSNTKSAGIDVAKRKHDVAIEGEEKTFKIANSDQAHQALIERLRAAKVTRVGLEASGGYERGLSEALRAAGFEVVVHQPLEVRLFARLKRIRAKNDKIDARVICMATAQVDAVRAAQDPCLSELAQRLTMYEHVADQLAKAKTFREHVDLPDLKTLHEAQIVRLTADKKALAKTLVAAVKASTYLGPRFDLLRSLPGGGDLTAACLIVRMPELGAMEHGQAASLVGVAPYDRDSATFRGKRSIAGGRSRPRRFLYLAALAAKRTDPGLKAFAQRLLANGKPAKVVIVAVMRKLIEAANLVLSRGTPWVAAST